jgi:hypothetical protein
MLRMRRRLHHVMHAGKKGPFYTRRDATGQLWPFLQPGNFTLQPQWTRV